MANAPARFSASPGFPISRAYRVTGRFIADAAARDVPRRQHVRRRRHIQDGGRRRIHAAGPHAPPASIYHPAERFYIVFKDASSGEDTYEAARFLYADLRDDGSTILDFNEAYNPPCAFNPFTTCPIPLPENRLPVKVLAGEKRYPVHVELPEGVSAPKD